MQVITGWIARWRLIETRVSSRQASDWPAFNRENDGSVCSVQKAPPSRGGDVDQEGIFRDSDGVYRRVERLTIIQF